MTRLNLNYLFQLFKTNYKSLNSFELLVVLVLPVEPGLIFCDGCNCAVSVAFFVLGELVDFLHVFFHFPDFLEAFTAELALNNRKINKII